MKKLFDFRPELVRVDSTRETVKPILHVEENAAMQLIHEYAICMAAIRYAVQQGRLKFYSQNLKRLVVRPLLYKMVHCLGRSKGFESRNVEELMSELEVERLLDVSSSPKDMFELSYATGRVMQDYYQADPEQQTVSQLLFSTYLHEASQLFDKYAMHVEEWGKEMDLETIMDKITYD